jgi:hypothetical protein
MDELGPRAADVCKRVAAGELRGRLQKVLTLMEAADTRRELERRGNTAKLALRIAETALVISYLGS